jgi:hypothetical protein
VATGIEVAAKGDEKMALRIAIVKNENGRFVRRKFSSIKKGDLFRVFEEDGSPVWDAQHVFTAHTDAYLNENDIYEVIADNQEGE